MLQQKIKTGHPSGSGAAPVSVVVIAVAGSLGQGVTASSRQGFLYRCVSRERFVSILFEMLGNVGVLFFSFFFFFLFDLVSHCRKFGLEFHLMRRYIVFESITFMVTIPAGRSRIWQTAAGERTYTVRASQMSLTHEITPSDCLDLILLHEYKTTAVETLILTLIALVSLQRVTCRHLC